jgi:hypothetical protein
VLLGILGGVGVNLEMQDGNYLTHGHLKIIMATVYYGSTWAHLLLLSLTTRKKQILIVHLGLILIVVIMFAIGIALKGNSSFQLDEVVFIWTSIGAVKLVWYCMAGSFAVIFLFNQGFYRRTVEHYMSVTRKMWLLYTNNKDRVRLFSTLYENVQEFAILVSNYLPNVTLMDSILEKMINRPILNGKKPRVSKYFPRIDNPELEICYNKIRRAHQDEGFVNTVSIFSLLLLATDLTEEISSQEIQARSSATRRWSIMLQVWLGLLVIFPRYISYILPRRQKSKFNIYIYTVFNVVTYTLIISDHGDHFTMFFISAILMI